MYVVTEQQDRSFMMKREVVSHGDHLFPLKKYDVVLSESFPLYRHTGMRRQNLHGSAPVPVCTISICAIIRYKKVI